MLQFQFLLNKLAEEASEVAQIALKTAHFGLDEVRAGQPLTNNERCYEELNDLWAIVEMLNEEYAFVYVPDPEAIQAKKEKVRKFMKYSIGLGMVQQDANAMDLFNRKKASDA
jgi:hypothetical protein